LQFYIPLIFILFNILLSAQTTKEELLSDLRFAGGLYSPYIFTNSVTTPAPEGYTPFYISHYGRHGSRWVISPDCHLIPIKILSNADSTGKLTELGKSLLQRMKIAAEDAADRYGDLSPLGAKEHKQIAERMFKSFPEIFNGKDDVVVHSRSTQVPRCIISMASNNERLNELNPKIENIMEATKRDWYLNNSAEIKRDTVKMIISNFMKTHFNPTRFIASLFTDTVYANELVKDQRDFAYQVFAAAINLANLDHLKISMLDVFTDDEIFTIWQYSNIYMYSLVGPSVVNGKAAMESAEGLLKNIIDCADAAINKGEVSADLRFGHDTYIIPLLALMDIKDMNVAEADPEKIYLVWSNFKASPMGTNLQMIFYNNDKTDDVLVKFLLCEKETEI
ncbi:MAG: histidine phosphatase family protein, partial [Ignavibacteriaceae bacterium]|nr:histidine phosphatase family protein [Ignavibacteriaceae bacterium]